MVKRGWLFGLVLMIAFVGMAHAQSNAPVNLTLARTTNSITLIVGGNQPANIDGLTFEVVIPTPQGTQTISRRLDDFAGFLGVPFDRTPAPSCFHIEVSGAADPISAQCQTAILFRQIIAPADRFWLDNLGNPVPINILNGDASYIVTCPAMGNCTIPYSASGGQPITPTNSPVTSVPASIPAPGTICEHAFDTTMVYVPETTFVMGLRDSEDGPSNERPGHEVTVSAFCIDVHEVTNAQYVSCVNEGACDAPQATDAETYGDDYYPTYAQFPVVNVTWEQAAAFCEYRGGRLPSEAEWELVARYDPDTGTMRTYPWGNQSPSGDAGIVGDERANFDSNAIRAVGQYRADDNPYGVQDLSGNAAEWVYDGYDDYNRNNNVDPMGPENPMLRVVRGGSYADDAETIRGGARGSQSPSIALNTLGFRCVVRPS